MQHEAHTQAATSMGFVKDNFEARLVTSEKVLDSLKNRLQLCDKSIKELENNMASMNQAAADKNKSLYLVRKRLALREQRPKQEVVDDNFHRALEAEYCVLQDAQAALVDAAGQAKAMLHKATQMRGSLHGDIMHKSKAINIDRSLLESRKEAFSRPSSATSSVSTAASHADSARGRGFAGSAPSTPRRQHMASDDWRRRRATETEGQWERAASRLVKEAKALESECKQLVEHNRQLASSTTHEVAESRRATDAALRKRVQETDAVRRQLMAEIKKLDEKMRITAQSLQDTSNSIVGHAPQYKYCLNESRRRAKRPPPEDIEDRVAVMLHEEDRTLVTVVEGLHDRAASTNRVLGQLHAIRSKLISDLKAKTAAMQVDIDCARQVRGSGSGQQTVHLLRPAPLV